MCVNVLFFRFQIDEVVLYICFDPWLIMQMVEIPDYYY